MFAWLFYTSELKKLLKNYGLGRGATRYLDREWLSPLLLSVVVLITLHFSGMLTLPVFFVVAVSALILTKLIYITAINKYVLPYTIGNVKIGTVVYIKYAALQPGRGWWVKYKFRDGQAEIFGKIGPIIRKDDFGGTLPKIGDPIRVFIHDGFHVAHIPGLYNRFCLIQGDKK